MAKSMELGVFSQRFLKAQKLDGFELSFDPHQGKRNRRAKRSTVLIEAQKPEEQSLMLGSRTVADLMRRYHNFAPETANWTEAGPNCYRLRLRDHRGRIVDDSETLAALRTRQEDERQQAIDRGTRVLSATLKELERHLDDVDIAALLKAAIKERYAS